MAYLKEQADLIVQCASHYPFYRACTLQFLTVPISLNFITLK